MDRVDDLVDDITVLYQKVLGMLGKVRRSDDAEAGCTIRLERGGVLLGKADPPTLLPIELDEFRGDGVGVKLGVPPVSGWTANAASQDAMRVGPSVVKYVGPRSGVPFR